MTGCTNITQTLSNTQVQIVQLCSFKLRIIPKTWLYSAIQMFRN